MSSAVRPGIVVVNYGAHALVEEHLGGIDLGAIGGVAVVVDNFSGTGERRQMTELATRRGWQLVTPPSNPGFGAGANLGAHHALGLGASHLVFLNPDVVIDGAALGRLVAATPPGTMSSPRLRRPDGELWFAGGSLDLRWGLTQTRRPAGSEESAAWLSGACLVVPADDWRRLGGFDPAFFLYWEDVDLTHRFSVTGGRLQVVDEVEAVHEVGATQPGAGKSPLYCDQNCRNRLRFAARHLDRAGRCRWALAAPRYAARVLRRDGWRASVRRPATILAALRGTLAGLALLLTPSR